MQRYSRRSLLAGAAGLVAAAGCLSAEGGTEVEPTRSGDTTGSEPGAGAQPTELESVAVAGSPGGTVRVRNPGEVALLDFFATWCAPCKPQMSSLGEVRAANPDLHMVSITSETDREAIAQFWREYDGRWPVAMDPEVRVTESQGVTGIPTLIVLAPDGSEVWRHTGLAETATIRSAVSEARA